jgi:DNA-binding MarR family transcriptional regulator
MIHDEQETTMMNVDTDPTRGGLQCEVRQTRPFTSLEQEAMLNIVRTAAVLEHLHAETFRRHGITATQYNVLRILRGAGSAGLCRNDVRDRLVAQVPDATRLLDRMESMGLVTRSRDLGDRRQVNATITERGLELLAALDEPVAEAHRRHLGHMTPEELQALIELSTRARQGCPATASERREP